MYVMPFILIFNSIFIYFSFLSIPFFQSSVWYCGCFTFSTTSISSTKERKKKQMNVMQPIVHYLNSNHGLATTEKKSKCSFWAIFRYTHICKNGTQCSIVASWFDHHCEPIQINSHSEQRCFISNYDLKKIVQACDASVARKLIFLKLFQYYELTNDWIFRISIALTSWMITMPKAWTKKELPLCPAYLTNLWKKWNYCYTN